MLKPSWKLEMGVLAPHCKKNGKYNCGCGQTLLVLGSPSGWMFYSILCVQQEFFMRSGLFPALFDDVAICFEVFYDLLRNSSPNGDSERSQRMRNAVKLFLTVKWGENHGRSLYTYACSIQLGCAELIQSTKPHRSSSGIKPRVDPSSHLTKTVSRSST